MKPSEVLDATVKVLRKGWCKGAYQDGNRFCIAGAMNVVLYGKGTLVPEDDEDPEDKTAVLAVETLTKKDMAVWNDAPSRTKKQVLAVVKKAAENLRRVGQ